MNEPTNEKSREMLERSVVAASPKTSVSPMAGATALVQRALAETQIAVMMAKQFPRDKNEAREKLVNDCCREGLAKAAMYSYAKGGTAITGPSIRLAEAAKNAWGNMQSGWGEVSRSKDAAGVGISEIEVFAWDSENNTRATVKFSVRHWRDTKSGGYPIKEEREIYELCANQAARRERACILKMIDGDLIEAAIQQCEVTLTAKVDITPARIASMLEMFKAMGVSKAQIKKRIQREVDAINAPLMLSLTKIYNSIKDGMSTPDEWFEKEEAEQPADDKKGGNAKAKDAIKKAVGEAKPTETVDPKTGEVTTATPQPTATPAPNSTPTPAPSGGTMFKKQ